MSSYVSNSPIRSPCAMIAGSANKAATASLSPAFSALLHADDASMVIRLVVPGRTLRRSSAQAQSPAVAAGHSSGLLGFSARAGAAREDKGRNTAAAAIWQRREPTSMPPGATLTRPVRDRLMVGRLTLDQVV